MFNVGLTQGLAKLGEIVGGVRCPSKEIGILLLERQLQYRILHIQKGALTYALC